MLTQVTKTNAAQTLLNRAIEIYLDQGDALSAIVLAGSAEDIFQDLLTKQGRRSTAARERMLGCAQAIAQKMDPSGSPPTDAVLFGFMRGMFNWLRHADKASDSDSVSWHVEHEAETVIFRAIQNADELGCKGLQRADQFIQKCCSPTS